MTHSVLQTSGPLFNEIAIADLNRFQIAILTTTKAIKRHVLSAHIAIPKRLYQTQGWLIYNHKIIAHFDEFKVGSRSSRDSLFKPIRRLAPAIPISFEVRSSQTLPTRVLSQAALVCELPETDFPHHTVFRHILPRFVRIYPFEANSSVLEKVEQMLVAEDLFISQNYQQLKRVLFYQTSFGL
ncbi:MAG: hypothetical protein F6J95_025425 [Leptolyngbya sp. SIO1E4]|nr:hypothetical protein [Leptolyngbya sp. SIO1E4]